MGIVSDPGSWGKGFVTSGQGGASRELGWTQGRWERPDHPEERERRGGDTGRVPSAAGGAQDQLAGGAVRLRL